GRRVELRATVVLRLLPLGLDPAFLLQLVQGRVERSLAHLQHVSGKRLQPKADGPPMQRLKREDLQEEKVQSALNEVVRFAHLGFRGEYRATPLGNQGVGGDSSGGFGRSVSSDVDRWS